MFLKSLFNWKVNNNDNKINEELLYDKYGNCSLFNRNLKLLVITDTHGYLSYRAEFQEKLQSIKEYDLCCLLGDITYSDYEFILKYIPKEKIVALLGNHDGADVIKYYKVKDLNGEVINIKDIRLGGIQGSFRYKNEEFPSFTHAESIDFLNKMEKVDILLSHSGPYWDYNTDPVHNGLKGITNYLYKNKIPINIHGHLHKNELKMLKNGTMVKGVYGVELVEIKDGKFV